MKNQQIKAFIITLLIFICIVVKAQPPVKFNYQGIARAADGNPLANQALGLRISIMDGSATGTVQFVETHTATTNAYGLYTLTIGGGTAVTGTIMSPSWLGTGTFIKVEIDPAGGAAYQDAGTSELKYVPYSIFSNTSGAADQARRLTLAGNATNILTHDGTNWTSAPSPWTKEGTVLSMNNVGLGVNQVYIGTQVGSSSSFMTAVDGTAGRTTFSANQTNTTGTAFEAALKGFNWATDANGYGVYGRHMGMGVGVYGESNSTGGIGVKGVSHGNGAGVVGDAAGSLFGNAILGYATGGNAVQGNSQSGAAVVGNSNSGTGVIGRSTTGNGVVGEVTTTNGVKGTATTGTGVSGEASTTGLGVYGSGKIGVWAQANEAQAPAIALQVTGAVKATGSNKFAYRTGVTTAAVGEFTLSHSNQAASDIIILTPVHTNEFQTTFPGYFLYWNGVTWKIYNASDDGVPATFPAGTSFNVIVIRN